VAGVVGIAVGSLALGLVASVAPGSARAAVPSQPVAVVALGDSSASGEGAGDYEPGTRGERGNWCHRSTHAYIRQTGLAPTAINLACSGATSADVAFGTAGRSPEGSQAARLAQVARDHRVTMIVAQLGGNDDPAFGGSVVRCVTAYLNPSGPGCSTSLATEWPARMAAMAPKASHALDDVRAAMRQAGYRDQDYVLVLASYPSPVTENMVRPHGLVGCPFRADDARWGRTSAVPQLSAALRGVADQVGARFLDLSRATEGHEACTSAGPEWVRRLTVNPKAFVTGGFAAVGHLAQESFHLNAVGHGRLARCLADFVRAGSTSGRCIPGADGALHLEVGAAPAAPALAR
jgi:lysophospholipase L1-like esterase